MLPLPQEDRHAVSYYGEREELRARETEEARYDAEWEHRRHAEPSAGLAELVETIPDLEEAA